MDVFRGFNQAGQTLHRSTQTWSKEACCVTFPVCAQSGKQISSVLNAFPGKGAYKSGRQPIRLREWTGVSGGSAPQIRTSRSHPALDLR